MRKRLNRFAVLFFVAAGLVFLGEIAATLLFEQAAVTVITPPPHGFILVVDRAAEIWGMISRGFITSATLLACGIIIELLDQIRWNALPADQRDKR